MCANYLYLVGILDIIQWTLTDNHLCLKKYNLKEMKCNIENRVIIIIKHLQINESLALNNPYRVDILLNK